MKFTTYYGKKIDLQNIKPEDILIEDIVHALPLINRYNGHTRYPYSVAEHTLNLMTLVPFKSKAAAFLHDASEVYLGDVTAPLKMLLPGYQALERRVQKTIFDRFGVDSVIPEDVHFFDNKIRVWEIQHLINHHKPEITALDNKLNPPCGTTRSSIYTCLKTEAEALGLTTGAELW